MIKNEVFIGYTASPSVVTFDMSLVKSNAEYAKGIPCREVPSVKKDGLETDISKSNVDQFKVAEEMDLTWFWFILAILIILLIAFIIYICITPKAIFASSSSSTSTFPTVNKSPTSGATI